MSQLSTKLTFPDMLTKWSAQLNPLLASPLANAQILANVTLSSGANTINHKLGTKLQGYVVILNSANATFYDNQSTNPSPQSTLILVASAATTVSLLVF
jgi:hypothetical protein